VGDFDSDDTPRYLPRSRLWTIVALLLALPALLAWLVLAVLLVLTYVVRVDSGLPGMLITLCLFFLAVAARLAQVGVVVALGGVVMREGVGALVALGVCLLAILPQVWLFAVYRL
jgi:hypothetical protein